MPQGKKYNNCLYLEPLLHTCTGAFAPGGCAYMDKPTDCCMYENIAKKRHRPEDEQAETVLDFYERIKQELTNMGIKYEELGSEPVMPRDF